MARGPVQSTPSGNLVQTHSSFQPRIFVWYFVMGLLLLVLAGGMAYHQLMKTDSYNEAERMQTQRRVLVPGPRGNIYDREGRLLVGNKPRFAAVLYLEELRQEFRREYVTVRDNYRASGDKEMPLNQMERIARAAVVGRYLDQACAVIGRKVPLNLRSLRNHFDRQRLLPFVVINDLTPEEYAKLIERLPVKSPLQVYTSSTRYYPYGDMASHALGFVGTVEPEAEDLPGEGLQTFPIPGTIGRDGLEKKFDETLQGEPGGTIFRVDPSGYRINPPLVKRLPVQGKSVISSLDLDLQQVAEETIADLRGAAVFMEVQTGEVLVLSSRPTRQQGNWLNLAVSGAYPPGSTFKLITALAGLRTGALTTSSTYTTNGSYLIGNKIMRDHAGCITGEIDFGLAIEQSVNTYFYHYGIRTGAEALAAEAKLFGLTQVTGIELPHEANLSFVGTPEWKQRVKKESWTTGDTANSSIGQGFVQVTPLQMACFMASLARGQTRTKPSLIHHSPSEQQRSAPIGLPADQYQALIDGMERVTLSGTARRACQIEGLRIAAKTGTAQVRKLEGTIELAWIVGFAPVENPQVAFAVLIEGDTPDEGNAGGAVAGPIAKEILQKWFEKSKTTRLTNRPAH